MILGFDRAVKQQLDSAQAAKRIVKLRFDERTASICGSVNDRVCICPSRSQSGYSQSASLLAHNRVTASQLIRSGLYHS